MWLEAEEVAVIGEVVSTFEPRRRLHRPVEVYMVCCLVGKFWNQLLMKYLTYKYFVKVHGVFLEIKIKNIYWLNPINQN